MAGAPLHLPDGTITCVFTDMEGSTRLLRALGPTFDDVMAHHDALLRDVWSACNGHEVKTTGDGFMVVFTEAADAVGAAVAAQRGFASASWPTTLPVRVRVGMHTGYARPASNDYNALVVNQAARVVGAARGGQVLLSEQTRAAIDTRGLPAGVHLHALGRFRVRDFDEPVALFSAAGDGFVPVDAPPRVRPADGHNLVRPATSLVGRRDDAARLATAVSRRRLTTVVGPGGVGKTRLAIETALELTPDWADGAWFVDLAPLTDPARLGEAIGDAVGAPAAPGIPRWRQVLSFLAERRMLVVLDNCEHLLEATAAAAATLVTSCEDVAVLATSREPLGVRGERVFRLSPLAAEGPGSPAVELFLDRGGLGATADRHVLSDLCRELDGLPLAIELAAARATAIAPAEILRRVRRSPDGLRSTDPTLPERQRSLGRLLDWSWDLLSPAARRILGRLTVFAAGFDLPAAEAVGACGGLDADAVADVVWALADASLIHPEDTQGATRYRLWGTVRAHAASRSDPGDLAAATQRLAAHLIARVGPARATRRAWVVEMAIELDNVRAAAAGVEDAALGQTLAWSAGRYHDVTDTFRDGIAELTQSLELRPQPGPPRVALLTLLADLHLRLGELDEAEQVLAEAATLADAVGCPDWDDAGIARTRGELHLRRDQAADAVAEARRGLANADLSLRGQARLCNLLGIASATLGDLPSAVEAFQRELHAETTAGIDTFAATTHANLAEAHLTLGDETAAAHHQRRSLGLAREQRQPVLVAFSLMIAARLDAAREHPREAVMLQTKADELLAAAGYALYEEDDRVRADLRSVAAAALGQAGYADAVSSGRALSADAAASLAEQVLAR